MDDVKVGDLVEARCGGPLMAAIAVGGGVVRCLWFTLYGECREGDFPAFALRAADPQRLPNRP